MDYALPARVALVTGLHGGARTRAVDRLLMAEPGAIAVHHDMSRIAEGEVHRVVRDRWGVVERTRVELVHSCVSCTMRLDLIPLLCRLAERGEHPLYVVEGWDSVPPRAIAEALTMSTVGDRPVTDLLRLSGVIGAVAADRLLGDLATADALADRGLDVAEEDARGVAEVLVEQVEYPGSVVLDAEGCTTQERDRCAAMLVQLNPAAVVAPPEGDALRVMADAGFDPEAAAARTDPATAQPPDFHEAGGVRTVTWRRSRPLHPGRLHGALDDVISCSVRSRGRFWLASHPDTMLAWDGAGGAVAIEPNGPWLAALPDAAWELVSEHRKAAASLDWRPEHGDRCQCISFTGPGLDAERLTALLDSCLLTDEEMAAGYTRGGSDDPFDDIIAAAR
ncbi:CobW family GTP-binding protein [Nocardiopsis potens]|uniref:CobW family GTP-binding protein n=1 Tax=Nocardiopsis potens TaxID=1246458 RepID=UPI00034803EF|nr:GTP-binding protein [Nocardiopsis potens]